MHRMILNETSYFGAGCRESIAIEAKRRGFKKSIFRHRQRSDSL